MAELERVLSRLGIGVAKLADAQYTGGLVTILVETGMAIQKGRPPKRQEGVDWAMKYQDVYVGELENLLRIDGSIENAAIAQVPLLLPDADFDARRVKIGLKSDDFFPAFTVAEVLERHAAQAKDKLFFDGENARLVSASPDEFIFQGCRYFDYIATNLSLDHPGPILGTLRSQLHPRGALEPLSDSPLANSTGVNGLLFSSDGYLVLQRRRWNVLIRPGELCSGFSGTIDKPDVVAAIAGGGTLADLDATRELVEEIGVPRGKIMNCKFLGITRELIRGGKPEMFYAADVGLSRAELARCYPRDKEGDLIFVPFGLLGRSDATGPLEVEFIDLLKRIAEATEGKLSLPLVTNIALWLRMAKLERRANDDATPP